MTVRVAGKTGAGEQWGVPSSQVLVLVEDYLTDVTERAHERLGDVVGVALTTAVQGGDPVTTGASTTQVAEIDAVQYSIGVGPCLQALRGEGGQYVPDLAHDERWGDYGPAAAGLGARSCVSIPVLDTDDRVLGVLKVYAAVVDGLSTEQRELARDVALALSGGLGLASALVRTANELEDRIEAMDRRRTIDLATGVLMGRTGLSAEVAFDALRRESQNTNTKLRDLAARLLEPTGDAPAAPAPDSQVGSTVQAPFSRRGQAPAGTH
jgi:GAF domain-containing protein